MRNIIVIVCTALWVMACSHNAITNRNQLAMYKESDIQSLASEQYGKFLSSNKVVSNATSKDAEMVRRVGQRLTAAITGYYAEKGLSKELEGYKWEYNLVDSKEVNACNERMSQAAIQQLGGQALSVAIANKTSEAQNIFMGAYGVGTTIGGTLPFSRKQELEADRFGLIFAAIAGYDPHEAIGLWERMAKLAANGQKPPEILSTHPSEETRIQKIKEMMPEAEKYYKPMNTRDK